MKKNIAKIFIALLILSIAGGFLAPFTAHAISVKGAVTAAATQLLPTTSFFNTGLAIISNTILSAVSVFVTATATFLSISMSITVHIKDIYEKIEAIRLVWRVVRDLSSIVIIFALLYFSILSIVGAGEGKVGKLIVNIFIAGIFINFSLFFVKFAIDASNIVSLQFYNAITPQVASQQADGFSNILTVARAYYDGGLSNVLLNSLKVQRVYEAASFAGGLDVSTGLIFSTIGGIIVMVTAAFSFLAASIAFVARTGILLFIMAASPIFFVGIIFPEIRKKISDPLLDTLKGQLIFMPVYLALLYVALRILSDPSFNSIFAPATTVTKNTSYAYVWTSIIIQYTIAIIFINIPLIAAIQMGGKGMKWAPTAREVAGRVGGIFGRNTLGRASRMVGKSFDNMAAQGTFFGSKTAHSIGTTLARATHLSQATRAGLEHGEKAKYGSPYSLEDIKKEDEKRKKEVAKIKRENTEAGIRATVEGNKGFLAKFKIPSNPTADDMKKYSDVIKGLNKKEVAEHDFDDLSNPIFLSHLTSKQFDDLMDNNDAKITDDQKEELKKLRKETFAAQLAGGGDDAKEALKRLSGKELAKFADKDNKHVLTNTHIMNHYTPKQLEELGKEMNDEEIKREIKTYILTLRDDEKHEGNAKGWMISNANKENWRTP